jgi:hypothetical protein
MVTISQKINECCQKFNAITDFDFKLETINPLRSMCFDLSSTSTFNRTCLAHHGYAESLIRSVYVGQKHMQTSSCTLRVQVKGLLEGGVSHDWLCLYTDIPGTIAQLQTSFPPSLTSSDPLQLPYSFHPTPIIIK